MKKMIFCVLYLAVICCGYFIHKRGYTSRMILIAIYCVTVAFFLHGTPGECLVPSEHNLVGVSGLTLVQEVCNTSI